MAMVKSSPSDPSGQPSLRTTVLETSEANVFFLLGYVEQPETLSRMLQLQLDGFRCSLCAGCLDGRKGRG